MAKKNSQVYVCANCAYESNKWLGQCPSCKEWSTMEEMSNDVNQAISAVDRFSIADLSKVAKQEKQRMKTGMEEFDRVLGGGLVKSEVILISGEPGIGKSTLLMQVLGQINKQGNKTVYISAEESLEQLALRGERVLDKQKGQFDVINAFDVDAILETIADKGYEVAVIDSVQTLHSQDSSGLPGGFSQIKTVASKLVTFAKKRGVTMIIVGQITKQGSVAGPKLLEHLVDAVMQIEGDEDHGFRILRSLKNRYGSVNEVGMFEMTEGGMQEVPDPSMYFRDESNDKKIGVCPAAVLEGNRVIMLEVQSLTVGTPFSLPKRIAEGISKSKLEVLAAIINKYTKINLSEQDIYINLAGGLKIKDPGLDLAVVLAILSSSLSKPLPGKLVVSGEVSLTGRIKSVPRANLREKEIKRLGYKSFTELFPGVDSISKLAAQLK